MAASSVEHGRAVPRRLTVPVVAIGFALLLLALALAAFLYDRSRRDVIANGVRIDGVAVGGLHTAAARAKVERDLVAHLDEPVVIRVGTRSWTLSPRESNVHVNVSNMVDQALTASREGSIFTRTAREVFGGSVNRNIPLAVGYSHGAVHALTAKIGSQVDQPPREASVEPSSSGLRTVPSQVGLTVQTSQLRARIDRALLGISPTRSVHVPTRSVQPAITTANLAARYPAYIVVDRSAFTLRYYAHLKLERSYEIAVGMEGLETPAGLHKIEWEQVNPPWYVPKKAWAGALAGTVVPPGPEDPLKARFMSFDGGAGIHGIDPSEYSSIGHDASHGCVRMRIPDVIDLYSKSPVGTPVYII